MKTMKLGLILILFLSGLNISYGQVPQLINYQAVVRDGTGSIMVSTSVGVQFTLLDGSTILYQETNNITTTSNGLLNTIVGSGTPVVGTFSSVDWSIQGISMQVEIDMGSGYIDLGTNQMNSVPYALYAEDSRNAVNATYSDTATVALTSEDQVWEKGTGGAITYIDEDPASSSFVARITSATNLTSGAELLSLYAQPGGATNFNFIEMKHGTLSPAVGTIKGDGSTYFTKSTLTGELGESGTAQAATLYADNIPMAWAVINASGTIQSSFGIQSVSKVGTGSYYIYLDNNVQGYPVAQVTGRSDNATQNIYGNVDVPNANSNEVRVYTGYTSSGSSGWADAKFHIVIYGRPQ